MKVYYSRVSTAEQNSDRQLQDLNGFDYVLTDKCSGLIPLFERPKGNELKKLIDNNKLSQLEIHSIDRLGRSTVDVLNVWKELTDKGITIICRNPNIQNFDQNGKPDIFSELMLSIASVMATYEKNILRERQLEGIAIAKAKKKYTGRAIDTKESTEKFLSKPKIKKILEHVEIGYTQAQIVKLCDCSFATINKAKKLQKQVQK
jgi:DNA invertase Pin-like site-specific DNA recombinase